MRLRLKSGKMPLPLNEDSAGENVATWYLIARKVGCGSVTVTATLPSGEAFTNAVNFRVIKPFVRYWDELQGRCYQ